MHSQKQQYMQDIISEAQKKRFKITDEDPKKSGIAITEGWFQELMKHPYHSSKKLIVDLLEKPGTGIFLMKEKAKLVRDQKQRTTFALAKRLQPEEEKQAEP